MGVPTTCACSGSSARGGCAPPQMSNGVAPPRRPTGSIPTAMPPAAVDRFGRPGALKLDVLPVPDIDATEVLIAIHTAGVGSWDASMREGWWPGRRRPKLPLVLGTDGSGTVAAVG